MQDVFLAAGTPTLTGRYSPPPWFNAHHVESGRRTIFIISCGESTATVRVARRRSTEPFVGRLPQPPKFATTGFWLS
jgi:hypothetical protein